MSYFDQWTIIVLAAAILLMAAEIIWLRRQNDRLRKLLDQ